MLLLVLATTGCATTLQVTNNNGFHATGQQQSQHINRWAWGLWNGSVNKPDCANGLHDVGVTTTFGEKLVTILTLGVYCPVNVSWHCQEKDLTH